tara:strand:- start:135 stop:560 length:426 start_codon:yes stop_codon:yes gene_type:complete
VQQLTLPTVPAPTIIPQSIPTSGNVPNIPNAQPQLGGHVVNTSTAPSVIPQNGPTGGSIPTSQHQTVSHVVSTGIPENTQIEMIKHFCAIWVYGYERMMAERAVDGMEWAWDAEYSAGDLFTTMTCGMTVSAPSSYCKNFN